MSLDLIQIREVGYLISAFLFILGIKYMTHPETAKKRKHNFIYRYGISSYAYFYSRKIYN